jgi:hypothetical protein
MKHYAGVDVSSEASCVCVVDAEGRIVRESNPTLEVIAAALLKARAALADELRGLERQVRSLACCTICAGKCLDEGVSGHPSGAPKRTPADGSFRELGRWRRATQGGHKPRRLRPWSGMREAG